MQWFKNRKTLTKLMIAFSIMAVLMGVVGYEGLSGVGEVNAMMDDLYQQHMLGLSAVLEVKALLPTIGREIRRSLIEEQASAREQCIRIVDARFTDLDENIDAAAKTLVTEEAKADVRRFRQIEPDYKRMLQEIGRLAMARQDKAGTELVAKAALLGDQLTDML